MELPNIRKIFLFLLIASVIVCAGFSVFVILVGNFGDWEVRILITAFVITCVSICGLACGASIENSRNSIAVVGIVFAVIAGILWIVITWSAKFSGELEGKLAITFTLLASGIAYYSLVGLVSLADKYRWIKIGGIISDVALVSLLGLLVWSNFESGWEITLRLLGVSAVSLAAFTILIPVVYKIGGKEDTIESIDHEIEELRSQIAELETRKNRLIDVLAVNDNGK